MRGRCPFGYVRCLVSSRQGRRLPPCLSGGRASPVVDHRAGEESIAARKGPAGGCRPPTTRAFKRTTKPDHDLVRIQRVDEVLAAIVAQGFYQTELNGQVTPEVLLGIRRCDEPN